MGYRHGCEHLRRTIPRLSSFSDGLRHPERLQDESRKRIVKHDLYIQRCPSQAQIPHHLALAIAKLEFSGSYDLEGKELISPASLVCVRDTIRLIAQTPLAVPKSATETADRLR